MRSVINRRGTAAHAPRPPDSAEKRGEPYAPGLRDRITSAQEQWRRCAPARALPRGFHPCATASSRMPEPSRALGFPRDWDAHFRGMRMKQCMVLGGPVRLRTALQAPAADQGRSCAWRVAETGAPKLHVHLAAPAHNKRNPSGIDHRKPLKAPTHRPTTRGIVNLHAHGHAIWMCKRVRTGPAGVPPLGGSFTRIPAKAGTPASADSSAQYTCPARSPRSVERQSPARTQLLPPFLW